MSPKGSVTIDRWLVLGPIALFRFSRMDKVNDCNELFGVLPQKKKLFIYWHIDLMTICEE